MRISIEHRTRYRFTEPQTRLIQLLRMTPDDSDAQTVVAWSIDVDCDARLRETRDGLGNRQTMLYADGPIEEIEITVRGEVLTSDSGGQVGGVDEPLPPVFFLRETERSAADAALSAFAIEAAGQDHDADRLNAALHARLNAAPESEALRDAHTAFDSGAASGRERAQILVAALRSIEIPARYVSGYRQREGQACAPHGWVEAHDGDGWIALDPSEGKRVDHRYVRVATGLDAGAAAPVAGSRLGAGEEELDVALTVAQSNG
jgi:transglutaminase-like putative cysteine protease